MLSRQNNAGMAMNYGVVGSHLFKAVNLSIASQRSAAVNRPAALPLSDKLTHVDLRKTSISSRRDGKIDHILVKVAVK